MKTEAQLYSQVVGSLYALAAATMAMLAVQNYRYGLYPLVYAASLIVLVYIGVAIYARFSYQLVNLERASLSALIAVALITLSHSHTHTEQIVYWLYPIGLLSYIALPLKRSNNLNIVIAICGGTAVFIYDSRVDSLTFLGSYTLMMALASSFAARHQQHSRTLVELAIHDALTGAYNMRHLEDTVSKEICRTERTGNPLSLVALEVDYFSQLKEMHDVSTAQMLIQHVAQTLNGMIRAGDSQYFDSNHRFYLLLPCTPPEGVLVIAERIRRTIEESSWPQVESITVSLGCSSCIASNTDISSEKLLKRAHNALEEAQRNGHNRVLHQE